MCPAARFHGIAERIERRIIEIDAAVEELVVTRCLARDIGRRRSGIDAGDQAGACRGRRRAARGHRRRARCRRSGRQCRRHCGRARLPRSATAKGRPKSRAPSATPRKDDELAEDRPDPPPSDCATKTEHRRARPPAPNIVSVPASFYAGGTRRQPVAIDTFQSMASSVRLTVRREANAVTRAIKTICSKIAR